MSGLGLATLRPAFAASSAACGPFSPPATPISARLPGGLGPAAAEDVPGLLRPKVPLAGLERQQHALRRWTAAGRAGSLATHAVRKRLMSGAGRARSRAALTPSPADFTTAGTPAERQGGCQGDRWAPRDSCRLASGQRYSRALQWHLHSFSPFTCALQRRALNSEGRHARPGQAAGDHLLGHRLRLWPIPR